MPKDTRVPFKTASKALFWEEPKGRESEKIEIWERDPKTLPVPRERPQL